MSVESVLEPRDEVHQTKLKDTLIRVLERMISSKTLDLGIEGEEWFQTRAITLAEDTDGVLPLFCKLGVSLQDEHGIGLFFFLC